VEKVGADVTATSAERYPPLSAAQESAVNVAVKERKSLLIMGAAGTGKSLVIHEIKRRSEGLGRRVAVSATTGVAAVNVGGVTLHSLLRLPGRFTPDRLDRIARAASKNPAYDYLRTLSALVVDEVSMMSPQLLGAMDKVCRGARANGFGGESAPFGGLQVIFVGDFFQLPPVGGALPPDSPELAAPLTPLLSNSHAPAPFIFQHKIFYQGIQAVIELQEVFRQHGDPALASMLTRVRLGAGAMKESDWELLRQCEEPGRLLPGEAKGIKPTKMYSTNARVWEENSRELAAIDSPERVFPAYGKVTVDTALRAALKEKKVPPQPRGGKGKGYDGSVGHDQPPLLRAHSLSEARKLLSEQLALRIKGLGSDYRDREEQHSEKSSGSNHADDDEKGRLGISSVSSAGRREDSAASRGGGGSGGGGGGGVRIKVGAQVLLTTNLDIERGLVNGSRGVVVGFRSLGVSGVSESSSVRRARGKGHVSTARSRAKKTTLSSSEELLPYIQFTDRQGAPLFVTVPRVHNEWRESGLGTVRVDHIPLSLAWAGTIHKSQGMSLDTVEISLAGIFEAGQSYVALSRVRSCAGLRIVAGSLRKGAFRAHPDVLRFYSRIQEGGGGVFALRGGDLGGGAGQQLGYGLDCAW